VATPRDRKTAGKRYCTGEQAHLQWVGKNRWGKKMGAVGGKSGRTQFAPGGKNAQSIKKLEGQKRGGDGREQAQLGRTGKFLGKSLNCRRGSRKI